MLAHCLRSVLLCFVTALLVGAVQSATAAWPERPVKIVNPFPPGNSADVLGRAVAAALSRSFGQQFVVENRGGAVGTIGTEAVARAPADGYTLLASPNSPIVLLPQLRKTGYAASDLVAVAPLGEFIFAMSVLPSLGVKTLAEFVALARANPGKLSYSSAGPGSNGNVRGEAFNHLAGIDVLHIPYRSNSDSLIDFLAGRVTVITDNSTFSYAKEGKAVLLAMTSERRAPDFPDVPTMTEAGYPLNLPIWIGLYAPAATPMPIQEALAARVAELSADPGMRADILKTGLFPMHASRAQMETRLRDEVKSFGDWIARTGIKIE
jgi:tripartite-type tricarboxylate transporter receptor subunit TctC